MTGAEPLLFLAIGLSGVLFVLSVVFVAGLLFDFAAKMPWLSLVWTLTLYGAVFSWILWALSSLFVKPHPVHIWVLGTIATVAVTWFALFTAQAKQFQKFQFLNRLVPLTVAFILFAGLALLARMLLSSSFVEEMIQFIQGSQEQAPRKSKLSLK